MQNTVAMHTQSLPIEGALIIVPDVHGDERGYFKEVFSAPKYARIGIRESFVQDNVSKSQRGVLRGLHGDPRMAKLVQVLTGAAFDVVADARRGSPTFGKWCGVPLDAAEHTQVYIPAGCVHGFLSLADGTHLLYKQSAVYDPASEFGIAWNDPDFAIAWPLGGLVPQLSEKDQANPTLRELDL